MGNVLRRYWLPAALSSDLAADGAPVNVKMLGESLVAFRDTNGAVALVDAFCPHRRAPMLLGRNEKCGLRCVYHGWKFDVSGKCVDLPTEPKDSNYKDKIRIRTYPVFEGGGMVWAYMGPASEMAPVPDMELTRAPETHRCVSRTVQDCNYLQALEGGLDSAHATIMHNMTIGDLSWLADYERTTPKLDVKLTDYGFQYSGIRIVNGRYWVRVYQYIMPLTQLRGRIAAVRGEKEGPKVPAISGHYWVPQDDVTTTVFNFSYSADPNIPMSRDFWLAQERDYGRGPEDLLPDGRLKRNAANQFMIDRDAQRTESFTGIEGINTQDVAVQEGMGPIADRSEEHLGTTDRAIVMMRRLLLEATRTVEAGGRPRGAHSAAFRHIRAVDHYVDSEADIPRLMERELAARF
jgi:phenylpropionate dioxygenase-like ring-hydroxylating dioxygenase large terminal subunit